MGETKTSNRMHAEFDASYRGQTFTPAGQRPAGRVFQNTVRRGLPQETTSYRSGKSLDSATPQALLEETELERRRLRGDSGHPFDTYKYTIGSRLGDTNFKAFTGDGYGLEFHGTMYAYRADAGFSSQGAFINNFPRVPDRKDLDYWGSLAINRTLPTKPAANLGIALAELIQDIPTAPLAIGKAMLSGNAKRFVPGSGKDYLSVQFGIMPTVRDVQDICRAIFESTKIIDQYLRDSGNAVRRDYSFPAESKSTETSVDLIVGPEIGQETYLPYIVGQLGGRFNNLRRPGRQIYRESRQVRFTGAYQYFVDGDSSLWSKLKAADQLANKLMGTRLTVEVLWEAMPFSWLLDWYLNIGTLISNAQALQSDDLVLKYGYLMDTSVHEFIYTTEEKVGFSQQSLRTLSTSYRITRKKRIRGNPYGFAANPNSFSGKQWAILAALGLTMAPRRLWD